MDWLMGRLRWILIIAALGGPVLAYIGYTEKQEVKKFEENGVTVEAFLDGLVEKRGRRSGRSYKAEVSWIDADGQSHSATDIDIDATYARTLFSGDQLIKETVDIVILPNEPAVKPHLAGSLEGEKGTNEFMFIGGIIGGIIGIIGSALMFLSGRKKS